MMQYNEDTLDEIGELLAEIQIRLGCIEVELMRRQEGLEQAREQVRQEEEGKRKELYDQMGGIQRHLGSVVSTIHQLCDDLDVPQGKETYNGRGEVETYTSYGAEKRIKLALEQARREGAAEERERIEQEKGMTYNEYLGRYFPSKKQSERTEEWWRKLEENCPLKAAMQAIREADE